MIVIASAVYANEDGDTVKATSVAGRQYFVPLSDSDGGAPRVALDAWLADGNQIGAYVQPPSFGGDNGA